MLEILSDEQSPRPNRVRALRLLEAVLPYHEQEAVLQNAIEIIVPYLYHAHRGLVLQALAVLSRLVETEDIAKKLIPQIPHLVALLDIQEESPLRREAARLLRLIAEFVGPVPGFLANPVPDLLVEAIANRHSDSAFVREMFGLLSRLANNQRLRAPLIQSNEFMTLLVRSFSNVNLRGVSIILASNIAMDGGHQGKLALLNIDILSSVAPFLESQDSNVRYAILSLLCLLAVAKDGKHKISTDRDLPDQINSIARADEDDGCREAAAELRVLVTELPLGKAIMGAENSESQQDDD
jgi:hypothetical protein